MRVSDLTRPKPVPLAFDLGDGEMLNLIVDSNKVTRSWFETWKAKAEAEEGDGDIGEEMLADLIIEWDVTEDDGSPYAPTPENLRVLSLGRQRRLVRAIMVASMPSEEEGKAYGVQPNIPSSDSTPQPSTSQNGPPTSPSPSVSTSPSPT